ncbi:MAG: YeeE/YedE family protein [Calditrichaeota bacterium]|nr:YeeE/YedE family protein [Calditrichota bacterium]
MKRLVFLVLGTVFGFLLSRAGATTYDYYAKLFLFQDLQLLYVIATAAGIGMMGMAFIRRYRPRSVLEGQPITLEPKPFQKHLIPGSLVFGLGWGLAGACPGTALVMLGEGKLGALFTIIGLVMGTYIYGILVSRKLYPARQYTGAVATKVETKKAG